MANGKPTWNLLLDSCILFPSAWQDVFNHLYTLGLAGKKQKSKHEGPCPTFFLFHAYFIFATPQLEPKLGHISVLCARTLMPRTSKMHGSTMTQVASFDVMLQISLLNVQWHIWGVGDSFVLTEVAFQNLCFEKSRTSVILFRFLWFALETPDYECTWSVGSIR